jgi:UDP-2,3-diacylglucosamine pyrophosphatase LpxH
LNLVRRRPGFLLPGRCRSIKGGEALDMQDWRKIAEQLKFDEGLSWTELTKKMLPVFPELSETQVLEKVRRALRSSERYHAEKPNGSKTHFFYESTDEVHLYIISDAHIGAHGFDKKAFTKYIAEIQSDDRAIVVILGDLIDNATQGSKGCVFSQRVMPQKQIENIIELLCPIREKIIFFCIGNHEERTFRQTGSDPGYTMCLGLNCLDKYNYVHGFITIKAKGKTYKLYATHNIGRSESKLKTMARSHPDCDVIIGGHIHQAKVVPVAQQLHSGKVKTTYAITGCAWLKDESYSISAAYEPVSVNPPVIVLGDNVRVIQ